MRDRSSNNLTLEQAEVVENTSGWQAVDYKLIVKKDAVREKTAGGIVVPEEAKMRERFNVPTGVVVSIGELAGTQGRRDDGELIYWRDRPTIGTRIMCKEFSGQFFTGDDDEEYIMITDKDIAGVKI